MKFIIGALLMASAALATPNPEPQPGDLCEMCTSVVQQLKDNDTVSQVEEMMDKACDLIPHFMFQPCKEFVGQLKEQMEEIIEADPKDTCKQIGLCPDEPRPTTIIEPMPQPTDGFACDACKWGWEAIEKSGPPPEQVESQLQTMCSMVPDELKEQCDQAVKQIVDQYREGMKMTPHDACAQLQLCDPIQPTTTVTTSTVTSTASTPTVTSTATATVTHTAGQNAVLNMLQAASSRLQLRPNEQ